jgi:hypothetical protein
MVVVVLCHEDRVIEKPHGHLQARMKRGAAPEHVVSRPEPLDQLGPGGSESGENLRQGPRGPSTESSR